MLSTGRVFFFLFELAGKLCMIEFFGVKLQAASSVGRLVRSC